MKCLTIIALIVNLPFLISCVSTSGVAGKSGPGLSGGLPREYSLDSLYLHKSDYDAETQGFSLQKMIELLEKHYQTGDDLSRYAGDKKVGRMADIAGGQNSTGMAVYQLENCQPVALAVLIAAKLPPMIEVLPRTQPDALCALLYRYRIVSKDVKVGAAALDNDREMVYLELNLELLYRLLLQRSKQRIDKYDTPLSSDLFDIDGKRRFDAAFANTALGGYENTLTVDNIYLVVPGSFTEKKIKQIFEEGLGDRDFSYKVPEIKRVF